jgi:deazaflavin-dependent oxidoreductase (nitroreductase family)
MSSANKRRELPEWIRTHIDEYLSTNGEKGHMWRGVPTLLLTTTGRKSGEPLLIPLIYGQDGDRYLVVASRGGAPDHPSWYKNLLANPEVEVQVGPERFKARARTANEDEKPALWAKMAQIWPAYNEYQAKTSRPIPVVILERA